MSTISDSTLSDAERLTRLRLLRSENVGPTTFRMLMRRFGTAQKALEALPELARKGGLTRPIKLCSEDDARADLERATEFGARFVAVGEAGYPKLLAEIDDAPPLLCVKGDLDIARRDIIAIVGARNASAAGRKFARTLAAELSGNTFVIASGLARGIDTAAHEAAVEHGTIAVLAGGIDVFYPPENEPLQRDIGERGLLMTEMAPGTSPRAELFPRRNRIIAGVSRAVIVVEAALRSGSLITARLANEQGRDVFAVPGSPLDPRCEGSNKLIKEGAALLASARDVLDQIGTFPRQSQMDGFLAPPIEVPAAASDDRTRQAIIELLSQSPADVDDIINESGTPAAIVLGVLLELELAGKLVRHGRQLVSLI
jgi:DNA processing protein